MGVGPKSMCFNWEILGSLKTTIERMSDVHCAHSLKAFESDLSKKLLLNWVYFSSNLIVFIFLQEIWSLWKLHEKRNENMALKIGLLLHSNFYFCTNIKIISEFQTYAQSSSYYTYVYGSELYSEWWEWWNNCCVFFYF